MTASDELKAVAERLADWVEPAPGVTVYLFGSRPAAISSSYASENA
jgi:hypothetical protein